MTFTRIAGSGLCLAPYEAKNDDVAAFFPAPPAAAWTPSWVEARLGIKSRRSSFDFGSGLLIAGTHDSDMALTAAQDAIENAGIPASSIDRVIYATSTPDEYMPDPACVLHGRLGLDSRCSAVGLTSVGCAGFIYALDLADSDIRSGKHAAVLIVGSVSVGPYIAAIADNPDPEERALHLQQNLQNAYIFGEGAGAMVVTAAPDPGILAISTGASNKANPVMFAAGGSRRPATHATVSAGQHRFAMDVEQVKRAGPELFVGSVTAALKQAGIPIGAIDHFVLHQVNLRLLRRLVTEAGIPWAKVIVHVDRYGNLDTATLPVAFAEARRADRIAPGDLVMFAAIGAGWQFGGAVVRV